MLPKHEYVRSPKLLKAVRQLSCQSCGRDDGTIVPAHTNWGGGKGRGIKADDNLIAALCYTCHYEVDQGSLLNKEQRKYLWVTAHYRTVRALVMLNLWPSDVPIPHNPEYDDLIK